MRCLATHETRISRRSAFPYVVAVVAGLEFNYFGWVSFSSFFSPAAFPQLSMSYKFPACMDIRFELEEWIRADPVRLGALEQAAALNLNDWCLAAGFVRNLIWDKLHQYSRPTPLADIDLIYFDPDNATPDRDLLLEAGLKSGSGLNWSVKNQARMHIRNNDRPYISTADAMRHWVEMETAIGVRLTSSSTIELVAPFGLSGLQNLTISLNPARPKVADFHARISGKRWLETWPKLRIIGLTHGNEG